MLFVRAPPKISLAEVDERRRQQKQNKKYQEQEHSQRNIASNLDTMYGTTKKQFEKYAQWLKFGKECTKDLVEFFLFCVQRHTHKTIETNKNVASVFSALAAMWGRCGSGDAGRKCKVRENLKQDRIEWWANGFRQISSFAKLFLLQNCRSDSIVLAQLDFTICVQRDNVWKLFCGHACHLNFFRWLPGKNKLVRSKAFFFSFLFRSHLRVRAILSWKKLFFWGSFFCLWYKKKWLKAF